MLVEVEAEAEVRVNRCKAPQSMAGSSEVKYSWAEERESGERKPIEEPSCTQAWGTEQSPGRWAWMSAAVLRCVMANAWAGSKLELERVVEVECGGMGSEVGLSFGVGSSMVLCYCCFVLTGVKRR